MELLPKVEHWLQKVDALLIRDVVVTVYSVELVDATSLDSVRVPTA
jgi:hypothetical protein